MVILKQFERIVINRVFFVALIFVKWFGPVPLAMYNGIPRKRSTEMLTLPLSLCRWPGLDCIHHSSSVSFQ